MPDRAGWSQRRTLPPRAKRDAAGAVNKTQVLPVLADMTMVPDAARGEPPGDADAAIRQLYARHARALYG